MAFIRDDFLKTARAFAVEAHGTQQYSGQPYVFHLNMVQDVLLRFAFNDQELQAAALLHDVIEDTPRNYSDVRQGFGETVAELVYAVTDELGRNRYERHLKTWPKLALYPAALPLKLADRIANVEHSIQSGNQAKLSMYRREYLDFLAAVYQPLASQELQAMWDHIAYLNGKDCVAKDGLTI